MNNQHVRQKGFSAIIAIVLIVLFALIGSYMSTMVSVSAVSNAGSAGSIQAWFAAESAVDWAVYQVLNGGSCASVTSPLSLSGGGLGGFQAVLTCGETTGITEGPDTYNIYNIGATASRGAVGQENFVARSLNVTVTDTNAPP